MGFDAHGLSAPYTLELSSKVRSVGFFHQIPHNSKPNMCNLGKRFPCFLLFSHVIQYFYILKYIFFYVSMILQLNSGVEL